MTIKRQNKGARRERSRKLKLTIAGIIFLIFAIVAAGVLVFEFCTAYKPSNGFKKIENAESTTAEQKADGGSLTAKRIRPYSYESGGITFLTIPLNTNGGSFCGGNLIIILGEPITSLPTTERAGYTFLGWFFPDGTKCEVGQTLTDDNTTLTAQWKANTHTITLNANGGELSETSVTGEDNTAPAIPEPTRTGYTFTGWQKADGQAYNVESPLTQDLTLTAQWTIQQFLIKFVVNGNVHSSMTVDFGTKLADALKISDPSLKALYSVNDAGDGLAADYTIGENVTVYAELISEKQPPKFDWKKIAIVGGCGVALVVFLCSASFLFGNGRRRRR